MMLVGNAVLVASRLQVISYGEHFAPYVQFF